MIIETIDLYEYFHLPRGGAKGGYLTAYRHGQSAEVYKKIRPAMLVIAGGGYAMVSDPPKKEPVALRFYAAGYDAFALGYSVSPEHYPVQLLQAGMAMLYLRREAARLELDGEHIAAVGFSAGAHLCGCISVLWDDSALVSAFGKEECERIRPDAAIFSYPVITGDAGIGTRVPSSISAAVRSRRRTIRWKRKSAPPCLPVLSGRPRKIRQFRRKIRCCFTERCTGQGFPPSCTSLKRVRTDSPFAVPKRRGAAEKAKGSASMPRIGWSLRWSFWRNTVSPCARRRNNPLASGQKYAKKRIRCRKNAARARFFYFVSPCFSGINFQYRTGI